MNKNMKTRIIICLGALAAVASTNNFITNAFERPTAKVTAKIVDEAGVPVIGANVRFVFSGAMDDNAIVNVEGLTDIQGQFTGEGHCRGDFGASVSKEGFYFSGLNVSKFTNAIDGKWQPWNPICKTILRPIGKPVALYAKKVDVEIPALDKPCGYDLEAGDWVAPYGKGMKADFIFTLHQERRGLQDFDVLGELTFRNSLDGLKDAPQPVATYSHFKWERQAPENDYQPRFQLQNSWHSSGKPIRSFKFNDREWEGYFFRVRTVEQDGKIVSARYGKIRGGIEIYSRDPNPKVVFTYYLNPIPNDRNLEWDTKHNLFGGLSDMETPREP
jgi:hypothetical protein